MIKKLKEREKAGKMRNVLKKQETQKDRKRKHRARKRER